MHPGYSGIIGFAFFQCAFLFDVTAPYISVLNRVWNRLADAGYTIDDLFVPENTLDLAWLIYAVCLVSGTVLLLPGMYYRMKFEEGELEKSFGKQFVEYRAKRWRLIPFVW
ncbi:hypothetical protein HK100_006064 [Physocladia obscura]|uniref:Protein-S-isoprenylcysteine O-methyltransferase n=1 Tax=Physocladia obscura TaxID=109957 RepID=A0AAD5SSX7_9FUNG|nr:hypothetical protein HK100_006064 [Physocladia obscura]